MQYLGQIATTAFWFYFFWYGGWVLLWSYQQLSGMVGSGMERVDCAKAALTFLFAAAAPSLLANLGASAAPLTIAVADFDYKDTSGEVRDQSAERMSATPLHAYQNGSG